MFCDEKALRAQTIKFPDGALIENDYYRWIFNMFPKFEGHTMVVPKRHVTELGTESADEIIAREELITIAAAALKALYPRSGVEIFIQTGEGSESSIKHLHWHVVPSQPSDPLRGFDKLGMFFTMEEAKPKLLIFPVPIKRARHQLSKALTKTFKASAPRREKKHESSRDGRRKGNKTRVAQRKHK